MAHARRPQPPSWFLEGACRDADPTLFFAPDGSEPDPVKEARESEAKAFCEGCPIRQACLDWSIDNRERHGIWGGLSDEERADLLRRARVKAASGSRVA